MINWIRKYEKPETSVFSTNSTGNSVAKTKAILASLGMGEDFIEELSNEQLTEYANSKSITATTSYIKTTPEGISTYVTKEDAENGARGFGPGPGTSEDNLDDLGSYPNWVEEGSDSYMEIVLVLSYRGNARYKFSIDAEWLQNPTWCLQNTLGACMQNCSIVNSSRSGWYSYMQDDTRDDAGAYLVKYNFDNDESDFVCDFQNTTNGVWDGTAAKIDFMSSAGVLWMYSFSEYKAHIEFDAMVSEPDASSTFNVVATYSHATATIDTLDDVSIGIDTSGAVSIGIINLGVSIQNRNVSLPEPITYTPD